jgi:hypothetical protein
MEALDPIGEVRLADVDECPTGGINASNHSRRTRLSQSEPVCTDRQSVDKVPCVWRYELAFHFDIHGAVTQSCRNPLVDQGLIVALRPTNQSRKRLLASGHGVAAEALPEFDPTRAKC